MKANKLFFILSILIIFSCRKNDDHMTVEPIPSIGLEEVADFVSPVALVESPDGSNRLFIVDQPGQIWILGTDGILQQTPFLDLQDRIVQLMGSFDERGLLGLAFHPLYATNGKFYVYYSAPLRPEAPSDWNHTSIVSEFTVSANDPNIADPGSERLIMQIDQPQFNHNGGSILFGPMDNYLYIALGDVGGGNDVGLGHVEDWYEVNEGGNAQNITANLLGKIIRIDINNGLPYDIPLDNPFVGEEGLDEIYAYGLRNPFRMSFDLGGTRDLFAMDAGQILWEEVNIINIGNNYGWNVKEGTHCFNTEKPAQSRSNCPDVDAYGNDLIDPNIEFANSTQEGGLGTTVIGGYVYRGNELPQLSGKYLFGVWSRGDESNEGAIYQAEPSTTGLWDFNEISFNEDETLGHYLLSFGQSSDGELYVLTSDNSGPSGNTGKVYKLVPVD
jgi:glucose/arabinose dehydrogenase